MSDLGCSSFSVAILSPERLFSPEDWKSGSEKPSRTIMTDILGDRSWETPCKLGMKIFERGVFMLRRV